MNFINTTILVKTILVKFFNVISWKPKVGVKRLHADANIGKIIV